jgi:hypothetical protein
MKRIGFGQVEPNHLSAKGNGKIYAQLPAAKSISVLENGMFAKYDYANNEVNFTGDGEWMLVLNEVKLYDDAWRYYGENNGLYAGYAMESKNFMGGEMVPRLFKTDIGDIFTTNCLVAAGAAGTEVDMGEIKVGDYLEIKENGYLGVAPDADPAMWWGQLWKVVKYYTMPDGQDGVKIQRVK